MRRKLFTVNLLAIVVSVIGLTVACQNKTQPSSKSHEISALPHDEFEFKLVVEINREACRKWGITSAEIASAVEEFKKQPTFRLSELKQLKVKTVDGKITVPLQELATIDVEFRLKERKSNDVDP